MIMMMMLMGVLLLLLLLLVMVVGQVLDLGGFCCQIAGMVDRRGIGWDSRTDILKDRDDGVDEGLPQSSCPVRLGYDGIKGMKTSGGGSSTAEGMAGEGSITLWDGLD